MGRRRRRGRGRWVAWSLAPLSLALLAWWAAVAATSLPVARIEPVPFDGVDLRGVLHAHTTRSDGQGTVDEVLAHAKAAGLDFIVLSDHNTKPLDAFVKNGVLAVPGVELSTRDGHVLVVNAERVPTRELMNADPLAAARYAGGLSILAHPVNLRRPWSGDWAGFAGMEVVSGDSLWREAAADPLRRVVPAALAVPISSRFTAVSFHHRDPGAFEAWNARPGLLATCGHDAHGYGGYQPVFRAMRMHVRLPAAPPGDPAEASDALTAALARGDAYCALDDLLDPRGFALEVRGDEVVASLRYASPIPDDVEPRVVLLRDGAPVAEGDTDARAPLRPGRWRAEVELTVPWAFGRRTFLWLFTAGKRFP